MECKEICVDVRKSSPEERKEGQQQTQLLFQINHTMPHTEEYDHLMQELCLYQLKSSGNGARRNCYRR